MRTKFSTLLLLFIVAGAYACVTSRNVDKWVAQHYSAMPEISTDTVSAQILIDHTINYPADGSLSFTVHNRRGGHFINGNGHLRDAYMCTINPSVIVAKLVRIMDSVSDNKSLPLLEKDQLLLTVVQAPQSFTVHNNEQSVSSIEVMQQYIATDTKNLIINYALRKDQRVVRSGKIVINNTIQQQRIGMLKGWKQATIDFLESYDSTLQKMMEMMVEQLGQKLR